MDVMVRSGDAKAVQICLAHKLDARSFSVEAE
jgi:hypothetical protein